MNPLPFLSTFCCAQSSWYCPIILYHIWCVSNSWYLEGIMWRMTKEEVWGQSHSINDDDVAAGKWPTPYKYIAATALYICMKNKRKERKERSFASSNTKGLTLDFWLYAHLLLLYSYIYWFRMSARHCWPLPHITDALAYALYTTINVYCLDSIYILLWKEKILDICALWAKSTAASAPSKQEMDSVAAWQFGLTPALKGPLQFRTHYTDWHQTTHT